MLDRSKNYHHSKSSPISIGRKNAVIERIIQKILDNENFLLLGHVYADEDCVASLVAMALLLKKFQKKSIIYLEKPIQAQLSFFLDICKYNNIPIHVSKFKKMEKPDVIFILDTPKPDMIAVKGMGKKYLKDKSIPKIEMDHHFSADADYTGDPDYRLTMRASSTGEILAHLCSKLEKRPLLLRDYGITELYSRNIVLAILTGMIGDAKLGNYLFKRRDKIFYDYYLNKFNTMLNNKFYKNSKNISSAEEILELLETISEEDKVLLDKIMPFAQYKPKIGYIFIGEKESKEIIKPDEYIHFIDVIKRTTNYLADKSFCVGISVYYEPDEISNKIQFRVRASEKIKGIDLRPILEDLEIENGGGHPGAIAFRFSKKEMLEPEKFLEKVIDRVEKLLQDAEQD